MSALDRNPVVSTDFASRLEEAVREQAATLLREHGLSEDCDVERLWRDALRELVGLGPLEALLADETVTDIFISNQGRLLAEKVGGQVVSGGPSLRAALRSCGWCRGLPIAQESQDEKAKL